MHSFNRYLGSANALVVLGAFLFPAGIARSGGLLRSLWACHVPCHAKATDQPLGSIQVSYCSTTTLSRAMIATLSPVCQEKTKRSDAVAVRSSPTEVATCVSSSNPCPKEGLSRSGFTCSYVCPSDDSVIRKFTACASTGHEAWAHATRFCRDAVAPDGSFFAGSHVCSPEGQTSCE